jgi:hypothetical protein
LALIGKKQFIVQRCAAVLAEKIKTDGVMKLNDAGNKALVNVNVKSLIKKHDYCSSTKGYFL